VTHAAQVLVESIERSGARRIAFLGLAKNVGKTTALVAALSRFHERGDVVGATSAGRDGEEFDAITGEKKPAFVLWPRQLVASAGSTYAAASLQAEFLRALPFATRFGEVEVRRVAVGGRIEIVGPTTSSELTETAAALEGAGARWVLIDGAVGRRAFASARVADGVVLSVGPAAEQEGRGSFLEQARLAVETLQLACPEPGRPIRPFAGALTETSLAEVAPQGGETLLVDDFASIFLSAGTRSDLARAGTSIAVRRPARLLAVTVNPTAPGRAALPARNTFDALADALPQATLVDLVADFSQTP
jgi:hypothetical protein